MRLVLAALVFAFGAGGLAEAARASIYVPGHIRNGIYIRPHFVSAPRLDYRAWQEEPAAAAPETKQPPLLDLLPRPKPDPLGEES
jgi:hypothetical protein